MMISQIRNHKNDYFMASFVIFHSNRIQARWYTVSVHTSRSLGAHPRQFPYTLARSAPAYSRNVFCEEERKTRDKEENEKGKERERSKTLWVRCRENF